MVVSGARGAAGTLLWGWQMPQVTFTLSRDGIAKLGNPSIGPDLNAMVSAMVHKSLGVAAGAGTSDKLAEYTGLSTMWTASNGKLSSALRNKLSSLAHTLGKLDPTSKA